MAYRFEKNRDQTDIVIDGFEDGIADSPYQGIGDMRNMNIISVPGEASVNLKSQKISQTPISGAAFTVATSGTFTYSGTAVKAGTRIVLNTLTGGTSSLDGVNMAGNSALITSQYAEAAIGSTRVVVSPNGKTGTSAVIKIGFNSNPSNGDLVQINVNNNQIPIQFVTTIGAAAGNVLIGANIAATVVNLLGLLQNPGVTNATQVAFSAGNQTRIGYFTSTSGTQTMGLTTSSFYWINDSPTSTTFTLTGIAPYATGGSPGNIATIVPASGSGTFSTSVDMGLLTQIVPNATNTVYYGIDTNGRVWAYSLVTASNWVYLGNTATASSAPDFNTGIAVWNGYILAYYNGPSGYYSYTCPILGTPPTWTAFKQLVNGANTHRTFVDKNNTLYWCDGKQIGSLIQLTTFDPATSATYTFSNAALLIQSNDVAQCMEQLGTNLIIGGIYNQNYIWDRFSTGYSPLLLPENNCHRMVTVNSNTYLFVGNRGRIYITNGANAELFRKVPDHLSNTVGPIFAWGGAMYNKNQLYFSLSAFSSGLTTQTGITQYGGIWAIDVNTQAMRLVNKLSYDTYGGFCAEMIGMTANATATSGLVIQNFGLVCGWEDSTESATPGFGSDVLPVNSTPVVSNSPYTNYESYVDSDMIPVGTYLNPTTDANIEFKLTVPTVSGEGVKLAYRQDLSQSFTDIKEFTTAGTLSGVVQVNFQKSQWLQIRVYTKSTASTPSYTRLRELRIR